MVSAAESRPASRFQIGRTRTCGNRSPVSPSTSKIGKHPKTTSANEPTIDNRVCSDHGASNSTHSRIAATAGTTTFNVLITWSVRAISDNPQIQASAAAAKTITTLAGQVRPEMTDVAVMAN